MVVFGNQKKCVFFWCGIDPDGLMFQLRRVGKQHTTAVAESPSPRGGCVGRK